MNEKFKDIAEEYGLYLLSESEIEKAAECSADAYIDHPLLKFFLGDYFDIKYLKQFWLATIGALKDEAMIVADSKEINGVSIWIPERFKGLRTFLFLKNGGNKIPMSSYYRLINYENYAMKMKNKYNDMDGWYLFSIVVRTPMQDSGIAGEMMGSVLKYLKDINKKCYLEAHTEENVRLYNKFGFNTVEIGKVPNSDLTHYAMLKNNIKES